MLSGNDIKEGTSLPALKREISQDDINRYARVSRDFNPIHINEEFARGTPLGGTIAHGMMVLAYISRLMTDSFGEAWFSGGKLDVRFKSPARPGDLITAGGAIKKIAQLDDGTQVSCDVFCRNQNGDDVIAGEATVILGREQIQQ